jgi:hypothetical protein
MNGLIQKSFLILIGLAFSFTVFSQKITVYGSVRDSLSGENLIGAYIIIKETNQVAVTNNYGFYSISLNKSEFNLMCSFIGYSTISESISTETNLRIDILLSPLSKKLGEVVVQGSKADNTPTISRNAISVVRIKAITSISGEPDVLKSLQLLPGVQTAGEGSANLNVRGGSFDQNLILLDEAPVYNASHSLGFFSVFNADAINSVIFYKGAFPSQYGGRLSSVVDITMKEGNKNKFAVSGGIGLAASKLTIEGPINNKVSFIASGRYSYAGQTLNLLAGKLGSEVLNIRGLRNFNDQNDIRFLDLNAKVNFRIDEKNHIYVSTYLGGDRFYSYSLNNSNVLDWGNATFTTRWNHIFSSRLFSNFTLYYSNYNYSYHINDDLKNFSWESNIKEAGAKADFNLYLNSTTTLKYGIATVYHYFMPGVIKPRLVTSSIKPYSLGTKSAEEISVYISLEKKISDHIDFESGLRYAGFANTGVDTVFQFNNERTQVISYKSYRKGQLVNFYQSFEPRASFRYRFNQKNSIKLAYGFSTQFLHLLSNSSLGLPTDVWMPPNKYIKPQSSNQIITGFNHLFGPKYKFTTELYYKTLHNIIDYKDNADLFMNKYIETQILSGKGFAYGSEFMLEKSTGKLTGWIAYTYSKTQYKIDGVNNNEYFSPRWDIRHNLSVTGSYLLNAKWSVSTTLKYTSGGYVTIPEGSFSYNGAAFNYYSKRNGYQLEPYHRMDISFTYKSSKNDIRKWKSDWVFSIYNVYGRKNIYALFVQPEEFYLASSRFYKMYLMGIVPTIAYNIKF